MYLLVFHAYFYCGRLYNSFGVKGLIFNVVEGNAIGGCCISSTYYRMILFATTDVSKKNCSMGVS
jgi:hypothetical protein